MTMSCGQAYSLAGRTALVTGGGSGIGLAIAQCLAASGARVIIAGRRRDVLEAALGSIGPGSAAVGLDMADVRGLAAFEARLTAQHGPVQILVNNAGNTVKKAFDESTLDDLDTVLDVQLRGALELSRHVIRRLLANPRAGGGSLLFIASMASFIGMPQVLPYTVAKTALTGAVRGLSAEYAARGIRVNAVAPGWVDTELYRSATAGDAQRQARILGRIPMRELGRPEDIGWACAYLASPAARYVTGQTLVVDGGGSIGF